MYHLRLVIYVGLGIEVVNAWLMMLFDDNKALYEDDNGHSDSGNGEGEGEGGYLENDEGIDDGFSSPSSSQGVPEIELTYGQEWIPYIVFSSGLISSLGSGMTVKFFPLFFKDQVGMSPSQVQIIYCLVPLVMVIMGTLCTKLASAGLGRVQVTALYNICGISMLLAMVLFKSYLDAHPLLLVPIYIMRTSLMNASYPLQESILMDFVSRDKRARWKSLDSVASFGWCGSAAFGGWMADKYDYTCTFLMTAIFQTVSLCIWCCMLPLVPRKEGTLLAMEPREGNEERGNNGNNSDCDASPVQIMVSNAEDIVAELAEPLL